MFIWKLVLPLRMTLITEEGSWEGRVLVGSSRFVRSAVQETERVEKNNEDCAVCFPGLGGDSLRFDHTLPIRLFQQLSITNYHFNTPLPWNTHQSHISHQGYKGKKVLIKALHTWLWRSMRLVHQENKSCPPNKQSEQRLCAARKTNSWKG